MFLQCLYYLFHIQIQLLHGCSPISGLAGSKPVNQLVILILADTSHDRKTLLIGRATNENVGLSEIR